MHRSFFSKLPWYVMRHFLGVYIYMCVYIYIYMFWYWPVHAFVFVSTCAICFIAFKIMYLRNYTIHHMQIKYEVSRFQMVEHLGPFFLGCFHTLAAPFRQLAAAPLSTSAASSHR